MQYEIKGFDKNLGVATVRFWTDDYPDGLVFSIDIPVVDGAYISGNELDSHIMNFAPYGQIQRLVEVRNARNVEQIEQAVTPPPPPPPKTPEQLKAEAVEAINKARRDKINGGFAFEGASYHSDLTFQSQLQAFLLAWQTGILAPDATVTIRRMDDVTVQMTQSEVMALSAALMQYVQQVYAESWAAKDALN